MKKYYTKEVLEKNESLSNRLAVFGVLLCLMFFALLGCEKDKADIVVAKVTLDKDTLSIGVGKEATLVATIAPANATNKMVAWAISDKTKATVDANGKVKGIAAGTATITVTTTSGKRTATCAVTVVDPAAEAIAVMSVEITSGDKAVVGTDLLLTAKVKPDTANQEVTWAVTEAGTTGATIATGTNVLKVTAPGDVRVKATSADPNKAIEKVINVSAAAPTTYTVTFDVDGGSSVDPQTVVSGNKATKPAADPTKSGFVFGGWYKEAAKTNVFNFETETITAATTIYAKWTTATYTVTFDVDGGSTVASQTITSGNNATKPADPTKSGFVFENWYKEAAKTTVFNFETETITAATTIYAKWTAANYAVTFDVDGGSSVASQTITSGNKATKPEADPTKSGFVFENWYKEAAKTTVFNFETETITAATTIYAKWTALTAAGLESRAIPDSAISASSSYQDYPAKNGRLNNGAWGYWASSTEAMPQWWQVDLGSRKWVGKVAVQGAAEYGNYISTYKLQYSDDGGNWKEYNNSEVIRGPGRRTSDISYKDLTPFRARYIRFVVLSTFGLAVGKFEVYVAD